MKHKQIWISRLSLTNEEAASLKDRLENEGYIVYFYDETTQDFFQSELLVFSINENTKAVENEIEHCAEAFVKKGGKIIGVHSSTSDEEYTPSCFTKIAFGIYSSIDEACEKIEKIDSPEETHFQKTNGSSKQSMNNKSKC